MILQVAKRIANVRFTAGRESGLQLSVLQGIQVDQNRRKLLNFAAELRSEDGNNRSTGGRKYAGIQRHYWTQTGN